MMVAHPHGASALLVLVVACSPDSPEQSAPADRSDAPPVISDHTTPAWSTDGRWIAFEKRVADGWDIWLMNADGSGKVQLTEAAGDESQPAFSRDGSRIVFTAHFGSETRDLWTMRADGSGAEPVVSVGSDIARPSYSADGERIVFNASTDDGTREIFVVHADGSGLMQLTDAPEHSDWAWWAPDGSKIHFESNRDGPWESYSMTPTGDDQRRITFTQVNAPVLSPDGTRLEVRGSGTTGRCSACRRRGVRRPI